MDRNLFDPGNTTIGKKSHVIKAQHIANELLIGLGNGKMCLWGSEEFCKGTVKGLSFHNKRSGKRPGEG